MLSTAYHKNEHFLCFLPPHMVNKVFIRKILGMDFKFKVDFKLVYKRFSKQIVYQQTAELTWKMDLSIKWDISTG